MVHGVTKLWGSEPPSRSEYTHWVHDQIKEIYRKLGATVDFQTPQGIVNYEPDHITDIMAEWQAFFFTRERDGEWTTVCHFSEPVHRESKRVSSK